MFIFQSAAYLKLTESASWPSSVHMRISCGKRLRAAFHRLFTTFILFVSLKINVQRLDGKYLLLMMHNDHSVYKYMNYCSFLKFELRVQLLCPSVEPHNPSDDAWWVKTPVIFWNILFLKPQSLFNEVQLFLIFLLTTGSYHSCKLYFDYRGHSQSLCSPVLLLNLSSCLPVLLLTCPPALPVLLLTSPPVILSLSLSNLNPCGAGSISPYLSVRVCVSVCVCWWTEQEWEAMCWELNDTLQLSFLLLPAETQKVPAVSHHSDWEALLCVCVCVCVCFCVCVCVCVCVLLLG